MATTTEHLEFVLEQLPPLWSIRSRKMFGEYMIYLNDKPILTLCDNTVFVKKPPVLGDIMANSACGCPYEGAKEYYILDVEDYGLTERVLTLAEAATPIPKPRKKGERGEVNSTRDGVCRPLFQYFRRKKYRRGRHPRRSSDPLGHEQ